MTTTAETSAAAAQAIRPNAKNLQEKVLDYIILQGVNGATDEEIQKALTMAGSTERPRRIELLRAGLITESGEVRRGASGRGAVVWVWTAVVA